jgi:ABC-type spermidine/putrescine transport system, permease component II
MSMANRRPWLGWGILALGFGFLYLPILLLMLYSFNSSRLATVWAGFSVKWYGELFRDRQLLEAAGSA